MFKLISGIIIFCVILFLYLHIHFHLKTSNDLEIYEIEQDASKDKMEEICDLKQPVLFDIDEDTEKILYTTSKDYLLHNYPMFEIKIRSKDTNTNNNILVPLTLNVSDKLFTEDTEAKYISENNMDFLVETGVVKNMSYNDALLRPQFLSSSTYDVIFGSTNVTTPLRYELCYRTYFMVTQGSVQIKLTPPKYSRYLFPISDYENFEFSSPIDVWKPQTKYRADFDKVKFLEITLNPGKIFFLPAYWWYSMRLIEKNTSISCFKYKTYMNTIANSPQYILYFLQNQNIERKIANSVSLEDKKIAISADNIETNTTDNIEKNTTDNIETNTTDNRQQITDNR